MRELFKSLFPEDKSNNGIKINTKQKKYMMWLVTISIIAIAAISFGNISGGNKEKSLTTGTEDLHLEKASVNAESSLTLAEKQLSDRLEQILSQIAGVGSVSVNLTLESSSEYQYAVNEKMDKVLVTERAQDGSTRTTDEVREDAQVVMKNMTQGKNEPVVIKESRPPVVGVIVVAQGANDIFLKEKISSAVQTLLDIPAHRVTVLPKESR